MTRVHPAVALVIVIALVPQQVPTRTFATVIQLETTSEDSANVSMGDLDGDGDLDLVLAKGGTRLSSIASCSTTVRVGSSPQTSDRWPIAHTRRRSPISMAMAISTS